MIGAYYIWCHLYNKIKVNNIKIFRINNILGKHCTNYEDTESHVQNGNDCCGAMFPISSM